MVEQLISGSSMNRRIAKWEDIMQSVERYTPDASLIIPALDPRYRDPAGSNLDYFFRHKSLSSTLGGAYPGDNIDFQTDIFANMDPQYIGPGEVPVLTFDGSADWAQSSDLNFFTAGGGSALSRIVWVWVASTSEGGMLISKFSSVQEWDFRLNVSTLRPFFRVFDDSASADVSRTGSSGIAAGSWHQVAVTWDGTASSTPLAGANMVFYVDGVAISTDAESATGTYVDMENTSAAMAVAARATAADKYTGKMAFGPCGPIIGRPWEATAAEIAAIYRTQAAALGVL